MQKLFANILAVITLMIASVTPSQASDIFSHAVLTLPDDPRINDPWFKIIRNQADWEAHFYATTAAITYPDSMAPTAPVLDFQNYQVISGGLGIRSSGGYSLAIQSVHKIEEAMYIHVLSVSPGPGCVSFSAITYPSITILVKKTDTPIKFTISELINNK